MDIGKAFSYIAGDEDWVTKFLVGGVLNLFPVLGLATLGYQVQVIRNVAAGESRPLPEWRDLGRFLVSGLLVALAGLFYAVPLLLSLALGFVVGTLVSGARAGGGADAVGAILFVAFVAIVGLAVAYALAVALWLPAALVRYAQAGEFGALFDFRGISELILRNPGDYVVALVVTLLALAIATLVGSVLLCIGAAFGLFGAMLASAHLLGQFAAARETASTQPA